MMLSQFPLTLDGLHDHLRDVPWEDIFKHRDYAAASEFYEWIQVGHLLHSCCHRHDRDKKMWHKVYLP